MSSGVSPQDIYNELVQQGASPEQAAGLMGNAMAESTLNPESAGLDTNGKWSYGLFQWNTGSYPNAATLVTGNPRTDLRSQVTYLAETGGFAAASGIDPSEIASNFAHNWERCAACGYQGGSQQLAQRSANAQAVYQAIQTGKWAGIRSASTGGTLGLGGLAGGGAIGAAGGPVSDPNTPVVQLHIPVFGDVTLINLHQARTIKAFSLIGVGGLIMIGGLAVLLAAGLGKTNPAAQLVSGTIRARQARTAASQRSQEQEARTAHAREREEIRTEGAITRAEGTAAARRYGAARSRSEPAGTHSGRVSTHRGRRVNQYGEEMF